MENPQRKKNDSKDFQPSYKNFGQDGCISPKYRWILLCLGLLNLVLLISGVVIGINCAKVKQGSIHISHPVAVQLISELLELRSNHSDLMTAEEEAKQALQTVINNHAQLKVQLEQQKTINNNYLTQIKALRTEKANLQSNISALDDSCGKCLAGWVLSNSSCYYFSFSESSNVKKNWHNSRTDCMNRGSDLAVIDSPEEQKFVSNKIRNVLNGRNSWENGFWVGLTDIETEDKWVWINNVTEVEPRYWVDGEPNNHGPQGEDCGLVVYSSSNPWKTRYDAKCQKHELYWLCEMPSR